MSYVKLGETDLEVSRICFEGTAGAAAIELTDDDLGAIDRIMDGAVPVGGPSPEGV